MKYLKSAILIALGDELLSGIRQERNCGWLANRLTLSGWKVLRIDILPDGPGVLQGLLPSYIGRADLIIISGGLGPTHDDCTRASLSRYLKAPLIIDTEAYAKILSRYPPDMRRNLERCADTQGSLPEGTRPVHNPKGSALGVAFIKEGTRVYAFPGVPTEFRAMAEQELSADLVESNGCMRSVVIAGWAESLLKDRISALTEDDLLQITILPSAGTVEIVVRGEPSKVNEATLQIRESFSEDCLPEGCPSVAEDILRLAVAKGLTISCAESCTGGLLGAALTDVPGSSDSFLGSAVCYSNEAKRNILHVPVEIITEFGAVSRESALYMARGALKQFSSSVAISTTGIAGPGGGSAEKPVGTVWFGLAGACEESTAMNVFPGDRAHVRAWSRNRALYLLRKAVLRVNAQ